jgi:hypothetical protein
MNNELDNKCKQYTESLDLLLDKHEKLQTQIQDLNKQFDKTIIENEANFNALIDQLNKSYADKEALMKKEIQKYQDEVKFYKNKLEEINEDAVDEETENETESEDETETEDEDEDEESEDEEDNDNDTLLKKLNGEPCIIC